MFPPQKLQPPVRKRRVGCLGCLGQCALVLVLGAILLIGMTGVLYPWSFYLGGKFHVFPMWRGVGKLHARSGDYVLYVQIEPTPRGSGMYLETNLTGISYVCTPRGESIRLNLGGGMRKHLNLSTDGEAIHLYMFYWPWNGQFLTDHRPRLELRGHWQNPNLVMDDDGSIGRSFQPDGTVYRGHDPGHPYKQDVVPVTFTAGSFSDYEAACGAIRR